ncbi:MAG: hypothetical protein ACRC6E_05700, partial [Fusobacteriaceae bacterium]
TTLKATISDSIAKDNLLKTTIVNSTTADNNLKTTITDSIAKRTELNASITIADDKISDIITISEVKKVEIIDLAELKKTEIDLLVDENSKKLIGKVYKGVYNHTTGYNKGDIYYKIDSTLVKFSINNANSPIVPVSIVKFAENKFKVLEETERNYETSNYRKKGVVKLNLGTLLQKVRDTDRISFSVSNSWDLIKLKTSDSDSPILVIEQTEQKSTSISKLNLVQVSKLIHDVFITPNPIKLLTHY